MEETSKFRSTVQSPLPSTCPPQLNTACKVAQNGFCSPPNYGKYL